VGQPAHRWPLTGLLSPPRTTARSGRRELAQGGL